MNPADLPSVWPRPTPPNADDPRTTTACATSSPTRLARGPDRRGERARARAPSASSAASTTTPSTTPSRSSASSTSTSTSGEGKQISIFFAGDAAHAQLHRPGARGEPIRPRRGPLRDRVPVRRCRLQRRQGGPRAEDQAPARLLQLNLGHPLGPYLKASLGLFSNWDNYQRDSDDRGQLRDARRHLHQRRRAAPRRELHRLQRDRDRRLLEPREVAVLGSPAIPTTPSRRRTTGSTRRRSQGPVLLRFRKLHVALSYLGGRDSTASPSTSSGRSRGTRSAATRVEACAARAP